MTRHLHTAFLAMALFLLSTGSLLGGTAPKSIAADRTAVPPRIDGLLDDPGWASAPASSSFVQYDPEENASPTESTIVKVLYDDNALYVGVHCRDGDPSGIVQQLTRRDRTVQADRFSVIIDSYHDHATAFLFSGSASGVQSDGILSQDGRLYDVQWDAVWEFDARIGPDGWSAEFRIPFSALRFSDQPGEYHWGVNFRRYIARKKETDEWVMVPRKDVLPGTISSVSKMGHLTGITMIHPPLHVEVLPYQVSKINTLSQPSPFPLKTEFGGSAGLDVKYGLTNDFTVDLAVNPDFGQVEVDQAVLNLTVFETLYPEKRPFFLEGSQLFSFGTMFDNRSLQLFYSRRIGRTPFVPAPDSGYAYADIPKVTTILGAAKLTGRTDDGLTLAALSALTDREEAVAENVNGVRNPAFTVEPRGSYNALRIKKEIGEQSSIGLMATGAFKEERYPALSGGVDWNLAVSGGDLLLEGYLAGSQVTFSPDLRWTGGAGRVGLAKPSGEHLLAFTTYDFSSNYFSVSNLGFYSQPREQGGYTEILYKEDRAEDPIRRYSLVYQSTYRWNWEGANTVQQLEFQPSVEFRNFWSFSVDYVHDFPAFDDANRGINGLYHRPSGEQLVATLQTDLRQPAVLALHGGLLTSAKGMSTLYTAIQLTVRPNTWMEFTPGLTAVRTRDEESWVQSSSTFQPIFTAAGRNLFGDRDVDQLDLSLRGTITFTRTLSFQFFTQLFLAEGHYRSFRELSSPDDLAAYDFASLPGYENPDFSRKILNANLVFRWEYLRGSTIYLVWTQERFGDDGIYGKPLSEKLGDLFRLPSDNVLLAKISYWWSL